MTWRHYGDYRDDMERRGIKVPDLPPCEGCAEELYFKEEHRRLQEALGPDLAPLVPQPVSPRSHTCSRGLPGPEVSSRRLT